MFSNNNAITLQNHTREKNGPFEVQDRPVDFRVTRVQQVHR